MTVFQSVAAGLPIVTTPIRAAADYLREPDNCLWVEPRNPSQLAEQAGRLLHDSALRECMSKNNRALGYEFTRERVAMEYLAIYGEILERRRRVNS